MKRFRVTEDYNVVGKFNTLQEVVDYCNGRDDISPSYLNVECLVDDITICCDELVGTFDEGECPEDLTFF